MTKITFDLEEFKKFLKTLQETDSSYYCRSPIEYSVEDYYIDKDGYVKLRRTCFMLDDTVQVDDEWEKYMKGEIE